MPQFFNLEFRCNLLPMTISKFLFEYNISLENLELNQFQNFYKSHYVEKLLFLLL